MEGWRKLAVMGSLIVLMTIFPDRVPSEIVLAALYLFFGVNAVEHVAKTKKKGG